MRKVKLLVASSFDGFIARPDGGVDWLERFHEGDGGEDYGMRDFYRGIDTVLLGRKTHDFMLSHGIKAYPKMANYVFTRSKPPGKRDGVEYVSGNPAKLIARLREQPGKDIWLVGGSDLALQFLNFKLLDEIIVALVPLLLGDGIPLFRPPFPETQLELLRCKRYKSGLVQLAYAVRSDVSPSQTPKRVRGSKTPIAKSRRGVAGRKRS
jgi:dihydrofolate reductase